MTEINALIDDIEETVETIRSNRPEDPETVSYALDDLERQVEQLRSRFE